MTVNAGDYIEIKFSIERIAKEISDFSIGVHIIAWVRLGTKS
jgi:hypothetical protein